MVLNPLANSTDHFTSNNNNTSDTVRPSQQGKLDTKLLINKEIIAVKLNKNAALLEAFMEDLVLKGTIIPLLKIEPVILNQILF